MSYEVIAIPSFKRELKKLAKKFSSLKFDFAELIKSLQQHPSQGTALGHNCYKIRMSITSKGKGKSGGARVITCLQVRRPRYTCCPFTINLIRILSPIKN